ncbi:methyl-accepting chemotaxis protein [Erwinia sp. V71]|uniref:methyl-accepting chemotaxis protein n=1 Tax=Erwinia sp. V71 TaxID=3369424 RepID=UPI003F5F6984
MSERCTYYLNSRITQRLFLTFSLLSGSLIVMVVAAVMVTSGFQSRFQYVQENTIPSLTDIGKMVDSSNMLVIWMYRHQSAKDPRRQDEVEKEINKEINHIKELNQYYLDNRVSDEEDREISNKAATILREIDAKLPVFLAGSRAQNDVIALGALQGSTGVGEAARQLIAVYHQQLQLNVKMGSMLRDQNSSIYSLTLWGLIGGSVVIILILGFFTLRTILAIRNYLNGMRQVMERASQHLDLTLRADDSRNDEIGLTAKAFNQLVDNIASSLTAVEASAQSVSSASSQISVGNEDLSSRTEEQAASLEQTAASMAQLTETVRQTAENTQLASQLAKNAQDISDDSVTRVNNMLATMSDIRNSSSKINDIIALIEGIAFQTNILALNAAVEAARAGEQGRGFAVVAGEVRSLAQRSSTSAREIKELIEASISYVEAGSTLAEGVGENMAQMKDAVRQVTQIVDEISVAAQEQSLGIGQVHQAVNQMDDVTQQNAALVEEASAASRSLMEQATTLNQLVAAFSLGQADRQKTFSPASLPSFSQRKPVTALAVGTDNDWQSF